MPLPCLLGRHRRVGGDNALKVWQVAAKKSEKFALPVGMQMQVDLIDEQKAACIQRIAMVFEHLGDPIEQITHPGGDVLIAIAQRLERDNAVRGFEQEPPIFLSIRWKGTCGRNWLST